MERHLHQQVMENQAAAHTPGRRNYQRSHVPSGAKDLQGPILVLGSSSFVGANLLTILLRSREDVYGATATLDAWRLRGVAPSQLHQLDLLSEGELGRVLDDVKPRTIINCIACDADQKLNSEQIYEARFLMTQRLLAQIEKRDIVSYVHVTCAGPPSTFRRDLPIGDTVDLIVGDDAPESDWDIADEAARNLLNYYGTKKQVPCVGVKLHAPYGPLIDLDDSRGLAPVVLGAAMYDRGPGAIGLIKTGLYIDDACDAVVLLAGDLDKRYYGFTFDAASILPQVDTRPRYSIKDLFGWRPTTRAEEGLTSTLDWLNSIGGVKAWRLVTGGGPAENSQPGSKNSVSAVIACYNEEQSIPIMYGRLRDTFVRLGVDYEIIFVSNGSTDGSEEVIREISSRDKRVIGITHSRSFGAETSFRSGLEIASKESCVLLDGDLQDPPEMIAQFMEKWREGYEVVYGSRVKREAPLIMQVSYKLFYRLFSYFSYIKVPHDAGNFSLLDRRVINAILECSERDFFLRGIRAYVGYRQIGVPYVRPERMFGKTNTNFIKNIGFAKRGILSFSNVPLNMLSFAGFALLVVTMLLGMIQVGVRILFPGTSMPGLTTIVLAILFFGSINLFAVSIVGEYIAKIFEEVKARPQFIRHSVIRNGEARPVQDSLMTIRQKSEVRSQRSEARV